jgi:hypothetical protein
MAIARKAMPKISTRSVAEMSNHGLDDRVRRVVRRRELPRDERERLDRLLLPLRRLVLRRLRDVRELVPRFVIAQMFSHPWLIIP